MFWWEIKRLLVSWGVVLFSGFHVFVFVPYPYVPGTWQLCPEKSFAFLIQFAKCKRDVVGATGCEVFPWLLAISVERIPEGVSCFAFPVENRLRQWAQRVLFQPHWVEGFSSQNWEMPPLTSLADKNPKYQIYCGLVRLWGHNLIHHSKV